MKTIEECKKLSVEREKVLKEIKEIGYEITRLIPNIHLVKDDKNIYIDTIKEEIQCWVIKIDKLENGIDFTYLPSLQISFKEYELIYKILSLRREIWREIKLK